MMIFLAIQKNVDETQLLLLQKRKVTVGKMVDGGRKA